MELLGRVGLMDRAGHRPAELSRPEAALPSHGHWSTTRPDSGGRADRQSGQPQRRTDLDLLLTLHREGRTILIVTHDETVATRAGRVIHLRDGRIWRGGSSLGGSRSALSIYKLLPLSCLLLFLSVNSSLMGHVCVLTRCASFLRAFGSHD